LQSNIFSSATMTEKEVQNILNQCPKLCVISIIPKFEIMFLYIFNGRLLTIFQKVRPFCTQPVQEASQFFQQAKLYLINYQRTCQPVN